MQKFCICFLISIIRIPNIISHKNMHDFFFHSYFAEWKIFLPLLDRPSANMPFTSNQGANRKNYNPLGKYFYSSSKNVSFISGKSSNSETVIFSPIDSLCKIFNLGFFVFPFIRFSTVHCVMSDKSASLLTVIFSLHINLSIV